jgi:hypothetical protein
MGILFLIGFALTLRQRGKPASVTAPWLATARAALVGETGCSMETDLISDCRRGARLTLQPAQPRCQVLVKTNSASAVRQLSLKARSIEPFEVSFEPARDVHGIIDRLVFLRHGGV